MSTQEKSGGTLSSAFTKGEYTHRRRGPAVATGDIRITDPKSPSGLSIVMDPQPFPRRFLGNIRSTTRIICNQGIQTETLRLLFFRSFPKHESCVARNNCNWHSRLVTGLVTVNGTEDSSWKHGMVPVSVRMVTGIEAAVLLSTVLDQKVLRRVKVRRGKIVSYY